ncbi:MAG: carboxylesterase type [Phenylobacterium sp.]|nr:carboxylesterase type [Phenylobacterium sp.]
MIRLAAVLMAAALAAAPPAVAQAPQRDPPVRLTVEGGTIVGLARGSGEVFRAIPYAAPPVGRLRWKPPQPVLSWAGERPAAVPGPSCIQHINPDGAPNLGAATGAISEDCLQLNVFAPKRAVRAPVMLWLHGGGHTSGAGWIYNGESFARDGVVFVAINYRLGALGYFAHPALSAEAGPAEPLGNYGQMDQIAALQWVKRNIAAFGGAPDNVTVLGESAGASSVLALLATPAARGLYQKAIVESGGGWERPVTLAQKEQQGVQAMASLGLAPTATAADLRALPAERFADLKVTAGPFVDGRLMRETPTQALASGHFDDVPLIIGSNSGEDSLMAILPGAAAMAQAAPPALKQAYGAEAADPDAFAHALFTDSIMGAPARWVAARASGGRPAWLYEFSYVGARFRPRITRAAHAAEIQYVLEYWGRRTPMSVVSDEDRAMASLMHACWVAFAKTSVPNCGGQTWPAYDPRTDQLMEFGGSSGVRVHYRKLQLDVVEAVGLRRIGVR